MHKKKYINTKYGQIAYLDSEKGKETIILLHGWNSSPYVFNKLTRELIEKNEYRIIRPWLPYSGESFIPSKDFSFNDFLSTFTEFINALDIKNLHIFGHSFGGSIALGITPCLDEKIKSVMVAGSPLSPLRYNLKRFCLLGIYGIYDLFSDQESSEVRNTFKTNYSFHYIYGLRIKKLFKQIEVDYLSINKSNIPILFMWGDRDTLITLKRNKEIINRFRNASLAVFPGHHFWILNSPSTLIPLMITFISNHSSQKGV